VSPSIVQTIRTIAGDLVRLAAVLCAAAGLTIALGMVFPVQYELDTAGYRETSARALAPIEALPEEVDDIRRSLGAETAVYIDFYTVLYANDRTIGHVSLWALLGDSPDTEVTLLPESTRLSGPPRDPDDGGDWIDVNADVARALGIGPGDTVRAELGADEPTSFQVRGVYAARATGLSGHALVSGNAVARLEPTVELTSNSMVTAASAAEVERMLTASPWPERMGELYGLPLTSEKLSDHLQAARDHAVANFGLVLALSTIALLALLSIAIGECFALVRGFARRAEVLAELGTRSTTLYGGLVLGAAAISTAALVLGAALGMLAYTTGLAGPGLPPLLVPVWWLAAAAAVGAGVLTTALTAIHQRRKTFPS